MKVTKWVAIAVSLGMLTVAGCGDKDPVSSAPGAKGATPAVKLAISGSKVAGTCELPGCRPGQGTMIPESPGSPPEVVVPEPEPDTGGENTGGNTTPQADAGPDQTVDAGATVTLDGSGSSDADGDALTYQWTAPAGITLSSATVAEPVQESGSPVTPGDLVWEETIGPFGGSVRQLLVVDGTLYAATAAGIWRTADEGNTWLGELNSYSVNSVASMGSTLYVATGSQKMFSSDDGGITWTELSRAGLNTGEYGRTYLGNLYAFDGTLFVSSNTDREIVQTLYRSDDGGQNWVRAGLQANSIKMEEILGFLYAGTITNMYRSVDDGATWVQLSADDIGAAVDFDVIGSKLYVATAARWIGSTQILGGVHVSETRGNSWDRILPNASMTAVEATSLAVFGNSLYVGSSYFNGTPGILRSDDAGETWESVNTGLTDLVVPALAVSGETLFAGTSSGSVFRASLVK